MLTHAERLAAARAAIDYVMSRQPDEQERPVPNCPGWTVYNAAAHIGRVSIAWQEMITSTPDDPESRERGYARSGQQPAGTPLPELASWAHRAIDELEGDLERACYFSMTGGEGTVALWGWHAASELGVHRLDVEDALGQPPSLTDDQAIDAVAYTCRYFLPAMRRVTETDPGPVEIGLLRSDGGRDGVVVESDQAAVVGIEGQPVQVLLAIWGRPHQGVTVTGGDPEVWDRWRSLPGQAFQFGTWD